MMGKIKGWRKVLSRIDENRPPYISIHGFMINEGS